MTVASASEVFHGTRERFLERRVARSDQRGSEARENQSQRSDPNGIREIIAAKRRELVSRNLTRNDQDVCLLPQTPLGRARYRRAALGTSAGPTRFAARRRSRRRRRG